MESTDEWNAQINVSTKTFCNVNEIELTIMKVYVQSENLLVATVACKNALCNSQFFTNSEMAAWTM